ncbi:MAG: hypothetical protein RLZZ230_483 [Candidatus Parcubacteria bacterium]|jgi:SAM-dependent methyltransferase
MSQAHTKTGYGVDIASERIDDMDKKMLAYLFSQTDIEILKVLDIGCGAGGQSVRMALAGARVVALDIHDFSSNFAAARAEFSLTESKLTFVHSDMTDTSSFWATEQYDLCSLQRVLHYLPYEEAAAVIRTLRQQVKGQLYLTVTGLSSDIGNYYSSANQELSERFYPLTQEGSDLFGITKPLCLYTQSELEFLLEKSDWTILESRVSAFGNIKIVCA